MARKVKKLREFLEAQKNLYGPIRGTRVAVEALQETCREHLESVTAKVKEISLLGGVGDPRSDPADLYGYSIRELAEALCGVEWVHALREDNIERFGSIPVSAMEASAGVGVTGFINITNVLISTKIFEGFRNPSFVGESLVETVPTRLSGETIAGAGSIPDDAAIVPEGLPFPEVGFTEHRFVTPSTVKRGLIVSVTKEAIFFDQTGQVSRKAFSAGDIVGRSKEQRILDVVLGFTNNYTENGTARNTYIDAGFWDNIVAANGLVDWTDIEGAEIVLAAILDPASSQPILSVPDTIIVHTAKKHTARRIVSAAETRTGTAGTEQTVVSGNTVGNFRVVSTPFIDQRYSTASEANTTWFFGNPRAAFLYMQNWPVTVVQAPQNDPAEFEQDIVLRVRASERGVATPQQPRSMTENNA